MIRRALREPEPWILTIVIVAFFHAPLTGSTFFFRDLYQLFYPKKVFLAEALRRGAFPLWDPMTHGGQPYLSPANTPFHPSNLFYLALPPIVAFNVAIVLHFLLCGLAAYALARVVRLSPRAAFVSGVVYALCGYTLSTANLLPILFALPWIPATIAFAELFLRERRGRWIVAAALSAAMPLLSGAAETAAMMFVLLGAWIAASRAAIRVKAAVLAILVVASVGLSMIQVAPAVEMMRHSSRAQRRTYAGFTKWSVDARRLPELIVPRFLGDTDTLDDRDYWGRRLESSGFPYIVSIYVGVPALFLAIFGAGGADEERRRWRVLLALAALATLLSLGGALPFFPLVYRLPLVAVFRYPVKALILALLPLALLAGRGVARLEVQRSRALPAAFAAAALALAAVASALSSSSGFAASFDRFFFLQPLGNLHAHLTASLWHSAAASAIVAAALLLSTPARGILLAAVIAADLIAGGWNVNAWAPRALFDPPPIVGPLRAAVGGGRFHNEGASPSATMRAPSNDLFWLARRNLETLKDYSAALYGIPVIFHSDYDGLAPERVARLGHGIDALPVPVQQSIFDVAGIRAVALPDRAGRGPRLVAFPAVQPVRFVSAAEGVPNGDAALARMRGGQFDPARLLIEGPAPHDERCAARSLRFLVRDAERTRLEVDAPCAGYIFFSDTHYPGWHATVDGAERPLLHADYAFCAVAVPPGHHVVEKRYSAQTFAAGAIASLVTLVLLIAGAAVRRARGDVR